MESLPECSSAKCLWIKDKKRSMTAYLIFWVNIIWFTEKYKNDQETLTKRAETAIKMGEILYPFSIFPSHLFPAVEENFTEFRQSLLSKLWRNIEILLTQIVVHFRLQLLKDKRNREENRWLTREKGKHSCQRDAFRWGWIDPIIQQNKLSSCMHLVDRSHFLGQQSQRFFYLFLVGWVSPCRANFE